MVQTRSDLLSQQVIHPETICAFRTIRLRLRETLQISFGMPQDLCLCISATIMSIRACRRSSLLRISGLSLKQTLLQRMLPQILKNMSLESQFKSFMILFGMFSATGILKLQRFAFKAARVQTPQRQFLCMFLRIF